MKKRITKKAVCEMVRADYTLFYAPMPEAWKKLFPVMTVQILDEMGLHFTVNHTGKMHGMISLSTTCKCNELCRSRILKSFKLVHADLNNQRLAREILKDLIAADPYRQDICICGFCFSDIQQDHQTSMQEPLMHNYDILNNGIIHSDWLPTLNCLFFRGESFGDFASVNAVINFYNIARKNPCVNVTAWTKNVGFFVKAEKLGYKKPDNFKLILSSFFINKASVIPEIAKHLINAVFTVYTPEYAERHGIVINCGARACLSCLRCYTGFDGVKYVNELLK